MGSGITFSSEEQATEVWCTLWGALQKDVYDNAVKHGFWEGDGCTPGEKIALMHQELSELLDNYRDGNLDVVSSKIEDFTNAEEECADLVIRLMDFCEKFDLNIAGAIVAKHDYNTKREYKHGRTSY